MFAEDEKKSVDFNLQYEATMFTPFNIEAELFDQENRTGLSAKFAHFENKSTKYKFDIIDLKSSIQLYKVKLPFFRSTYNVGVFYRYCKEEGIKGYDREFTLFDGPGDDPFNEGPVISHDKQAIGVTLHGSNCDYKYFSISSGYKFGMYFMGKSHFISQTDLAYLYSQDRFIFLDVDMLTISVKFPFSDKYKQSFNPIVPSDSLNHTGFKFEYGMYKSRFPSVFGGMNYGLSVFDIAVLRAGLLCRPYIMASDGFFDSDLKYEEMSMASFLEFPVTAEINFMDMVTILGGIKFCHIFNTEQTVDVNYESPRLHYTKSLTGVDKEYFGFVFGGLFNFKNFDIGLRYNAVGKKLVIPQQEVNAVEELYLPEIEYSLSGMEVFIRHAFF